jgi:hypothetical protein
MAAPTDFVMIDTERSATNALALEDLIRFTWGVLDRCSYATAALRPYDRQGMPTFIQFFEFFDCVPIPSVDCPVASVPIVKTYI